MNGVAIEAVLAGGYAAFLLVTACGMDLFARNVHRSVGLHTGGSRYRSGDDPETCPWGQACPLGDGSAHPPAPTPCTFCPTRRLGTDAAGCLEVTRSPVPWPHSEASRFRRGIALTLVVLAAVIVLVELPRHHRVAELAMLGTVLTGCLVIGRRLTARLRTTVDDVPASSNGHRDPPPSAAGT